MPGMISELHLYFLQSNVQYFRQDNPMDVLYIVIGIGVFIVIGIIFRLIRGGTGSSPSNRGGKSMKGGGPAVSARKFNSFTLYRVASAYGLDRDQTKLLEYVFRNDGVTDPEKVMRTPALLDRHFKRAYKSIGKGSTNDDEAQARLVKLFSLRNIIEAAPGTGGAQPSSGKLAENTPAVLVCGKDNFSVKVVSSGNQHVTINMPRNTLGTPVRLTKGSKVTLSFFTKSSKGFAFDGTVSGVVETPSGPGLQIAHTGKMKSLVKRMYKRRQTSVQCEFFMVFLEDSEAGKKKSSKLIVDTKRFTGTVQDVSIGGCAIKTSASIQVGSRLKISIDHNDNSLINVLGQVIRSNRSGPTGTILHIRFLKVPRKAFNVISTLVFGYDEE